MSAAKRRRLVIAARSKRAREDRPTDHGTGTPVKTDRPARRDLDRKLTARGRA